ncbi:ABC transporter substrate-binding protein [Gilliamella sp. B2865]|uniref:heme/hemin ABC transporter substrate-binding protein n=1 Tax=unclassified Gilliamella TaxID=2685620 RepID=UPI000810BB76|nr:MULTISPECIES: ABC transporter substrate-binding protein [Gilliamella]MCX8585173.1 ABC transporter substrate-binding protein [Gilliamella sp. B3562]MCX8669819.1 ABC transporter substrate-binding protein [Gilliamella sp. B2785]MCX8675428.1 ABC transporter substrate-binding protein [Gilliamella sp. B3023]MCX8678542.1 ABC transporter substrate-binding protein [Gilliamella sp. B2865]MCX8685161.1 ABC transporter substrate-binding protein [Gilliamella sp. B2864]
MKKNFIKRISLFLLIFSINSLLNYSLANERIVIAGGSLTEIVFALGAGDDVVGVDKTSSYPEKVKQLPQIGYWKLLNIEGVLSLRPTLFITLNDVEPDNVIEKVSESKVDVLALRRVPGTIELLYENINKIASKLNKQEEGEKLINRIKANLADIQAKIATHPQKTKVLSLMSMSGSNSVAGKNTTIDALITIAGGENLATHNSFKSYTAESIIAINPEVIILNKYSIDQLGGLDKVNTIPGITETSAFKNNRITVIDDSYLFGIGPRVDEAAKLLFQSFYPE